jgi:hypothetical protein
MLGNLASCNGTMFSLLIVGLSAIQSLGHVAANIYDQDRVFIPACLILVPAAWLTWRRWPDSWRTALEWVRHCRLINMSDTAAILLVALLPFALRIASLPVRPIPTPGIHDEFSYLLAADTFAHFRLTNPTHPVWESFETMHTLQRPTYASQYPPAQGLMLAVGQVLFGHPFWGVCLGFCLFCSLIYWACRGWLSRGWALFGAMIPALQFGSGYWLNSYWGGAVSGFAACLLIGSAARIWRVRPEHAGTRVQGIWMGLGIAILANSRPWEGMWLTIGVLLALAWRWFFRREVSYRKRIARALLPCLAVLVLAGAWDAYYNWRVTGNPLQLPYQLGRQTYATAPVFIFQHAAPRKTYRYEALRHLYEEWEPEFQHADRYPTLAGFAKGAAFRLDIALTLLLGPGMGVLVLLFWRRWVLNPKFLVICSGTCGFGVGLLLQRYVLAHYLAPLVGCAAIVKTECVRRLYFWKWRGRPVGLAVAPAVVCAALVAAFGTYNYVSERPDLIDPSAYARLHTQQSLASRPGRQLAIVRYQPEHDFHREWVFNGADIDAEQVIWARESDAEQNRKLFDYFADRSIWLVEPDRTPVGVTLLRGPKPQ